MKINFHGLQNKAAFIAHNWNIDNHIVKATLTDDKNGLDKLEFSRLLELCPPLEEDTIGIAILYKSPRVNTTQGGPPKDIFVNGAKIPAVRGNMDILVNHVIIPVKEEYSYIFDDIKLFLNRIIKDETENPIKKNYRSINEFLVFDSNSVKHTAKGMLGTINEIIGQDLTPKH